eukprot:14747737-Alexandrium_andersonii.AAC.1
MGNEQLTAAWGRLIGLMPMASQDQAGRARVTAWRSAATPRRSYARPRCARGGRGGAGHAR